MWPRALGLPRDCVAAAQRIGEALAAGRTRTISLGRANGRRFTFAAGIGADAEFIRRIESRGRTHDGRLPGDVTAAWGLVQQFAQTMRYTPRLRIEGLGRASGAFVMNGSVSTYVGASPCASRRTLGSSWAWMSPGRSSCAHARCRRWPGPACAGSRCRAWVIYGHDLDRVIVYCDLPMPLQVDGEDLGDVREAHFEAERGAVKVLT